MDNQTLGAAIALCNSQINERLEDIAGELDSIIVSIENDRLVLREKEGDS